MSQTKLVAHRHCFQNWSGSHAFTLQLDVPYTSGHGQSAIYLSKIGQCSVFSKIPNGVVRFTVYINIETICQSKSIKCTIHHYDLSPFNKDGHTCWTPRLLAMTMPPILVTLSASRGSSALWSSVSLMACPSRHRIALVSPTCAMCNLIPRWRRHTVAVVPQLYTGVSVY